MEFLPFFTLISTNTQIAVQTALTQLAQPCPPTHWPLQDILMDHSLRSISYIADIGDLVVLMARRVPGQQGEQPEE